MAEASASPNPGGALSDTVRSLLSLVRRQGQGEQLSNDERDLIEIIYKGTPRSPAAVGRLNEISDGLGLKDMNPKEPPAPYCPISICSKPFGTRDAVLKHAQAVSCDTSMDAEYQALHREFWVKYTGRHLACDICYTRIRRLPVLVKHEMGVHSMLSLTFSG